MKGVYKMNEQSNTDIFVDKLNLSHWSTIYNADCSNAIRDTCYADQKELNILGDSSASSNTLMANI